MTRLATSGFNALTAFQVKFSLGNLAGYGIIEYEYVDSSGRVQTTSLGDVNNLSTVIPESLPTSLFVRQLVSVTFAMISSNTVVAAVATFFQWG